MSRLSSARCGALLALVLVSVSPARAHAQRRGRFEPTDLDLQPAGTAEIDLQGGYITGENGKRWFAPDFEASIGVTSHAELEVDGTYGLDRNGKGAALDNTLLALRLQMLDLPDAPGSKSAWSGGIQAGPRFPTLPGTRGLGLEALAIVGRTAGRMHLYAQVGSLADCAQAGSDGRSYRPLAVEGGFDLDLDLDDADAWSLEGELSAVKFFSEDRDQLHLTLGPSVNVTKALQLSLIGVVGFLPGGDRAGVLLGAITHFKTF